MPKEGGRIIDKTEIVSSMASYSIPTRATPCDCSPQRHVYLQCELSADRWTHVAGVYKASKRIMKLYVDGKEAASVTGGEFLRFARRKGRFVRRGRQGSSRFLGDIRRVADYRRGPRRRPPNAASTETLPAFWRNRFSTPRRKASSRLQAHWR